jgi:hypothetical protein
MTDTVYCLGCGQAFPIDADPYPLNGGMCGPCVAEQRQRPWQIIAENERLRDALDFMCGGIDREPWITVYRDAGGGYEGLQAVAKAALRDAR